MEKPVRQRVKLTERDLRLLSIFRIVAEAGGLTVAEVSLGMERSTISRHLKVLEARIGGRLCSRGPTGFELTELGRRVFRAALTAGDALLSVEDELADRLAALTGELNLGIADHTITNPECRAAELIGRFRKVASEVEIRLSIRPPQELVEDILMRRSELGILCPPSERTNLATIPLFAEEFRLYARRPQTGSLSLKDLAGRGFALAMREGNWQSEAVAAEFGLARRGIGRGLEAAAILVASGQYVGFLATHLIEALQFRYPLVEIEGAERFRYIKIFSLAHDPKRPLSAAAGVFIQLARLVHGEYPRDILPDNQRALD